MKKLLTLTFFLLYLNNLNSQSYPVLGLYMYNYLLYNPAFAGYSNNKDISFTYRNNFLKKKNIFSGIPRQSIVLAYDMHINKINSGIGLIAIDDKIPWKRNSSLALAYNYKLCLSDKINLRVGTKFKFEYEELDYDGVALDLSHSPPPDYLDKRFDLDFGIWIDRSNLFVGLSFDNLLHHNSYNPSKPTFFESFYGLAGYKFSTSKKLEIQPTVILYNMDYFRNSLGINTNFIHNKSFIWGIGYLRGDLSLNTGIVLFEKLDLLFSCNNNFISSIIKHSPTVEGSIRYRF